jgi:hypothetical protein
VVGGQDQQAVALRIAQLGGQTRRQHGRQRGGITFAHPLKNLLQKFQRVSVKHRQSQGSAHLAQSCLVVETKTMVTAQEATAQATNLCMRVSHQAKALAAPCRGDAGGKRILAMGKPSRKAN